MISSMERFTATFDPKTLAAIRKVVGPRGVSGFLQAAAAERLARMQLLAVLDDLDAKHGAVPADVMAEIDRDARAHFGRSEKPKRRAGAR